MQAIRRTLTWLLALAAGVALICGFTSFAYAEDQQPLTAEQALAPANAEGADVATEDETVDISTAVEPQATYTVTVYAERTTRIQVNAGSTLSMSSLPAAPHWTSTVRDSHGLSTQLGRFHGWLIVDSKPNYTLWQILPSLTSGVETASTTVNANHKLFTSSTRVNCNTILMPLYETDNAYAVRMRIPAPQERSTAQWDGNNLEYSEIEYYPTSYRLTANSYCFQDADRAVMRLSKFKNTQLFGWFDGPNLASGWHDFSRQPAEDTLVVVYGLYKDKPKEVTVPVSPDPTRRYIYRIFNPYTNEHLYVSDPNEVRRCTGAGWEYEGIAWDAPKNNGEPVYRLYNPYSTDHHYTMSWNEYVSLGRIGWRQEGVGFYSAGSTGVPVYRLFNPYVTVGTHQYTTSYNEYNQLGVHGWNREGVGWYAHR